jgi:ATP-dependent 26S proteasome regulatory subunit
MKGDRFMAKRAQLDYQWIEEGILKLRSRFSNLIFFETEDPERFDQFLKMVGSLQEYAGHEIFQYNRWDGLSHLDRQQGRYLPVSMGEGDRYAVEAGESMGLEPGIKDPSAAFRHVDRELKKQSGLLLIKDMDHSGGDLQGRDQVMTAAFRAWTHDPEMAYHRSAVICFCASASLVVDEQTLRRAAVIKVDLAQDTERAWVIYQAVRRVDLPEAVLERSLGALVNITAGLNLHQLQSILLESYTRHQAITPDAVASLKTQWIAREEIVEILQPGGGFEQVGGYEPVKDFIRNTIIKALSNPEIAAYYGISLPKGILFFGPPGTGKTLFAKALAGATHLPFINLKTENLFSKYLGDSGRLFSRAIAIAEKNAPAIVFVDEIDRFGSRRGATGDSAGEETRRVYNQILEWLGDDERKTILVGTTNRPQDLDEAMLREGRLDYKVPILYPDLDARLHILRIHLGLTGACRPLPVADQDALEAMIRRVAERTEHFSGAELKGLAQRIRRNGFLRGGQYAEQEDFLRAIESYGVNRQERSQQIQEYREYAKRFTNDSSLLKGV